MDLLKDLSTNLLLFLDAIPAVRAILAFLLVFLVPGFAWTLVFFGSGKLSVLERAVISVGISIASITLAVFVSNLLLDIKISGLNIVLIIILITVIPLLIYSLKGIFRKNNNGCQLEGWSSLCRLFRKFRIDDRKKRAYKFEYLALLLILGLAIYVAMIPRFGYAYPVHLDEWFNIAYANQILDEGTITNLVDPFKGGAASLVQSAEKGFQILLAVFYKISGLDWLVIFRFLPATIFSVTVLATYLLGRKLGFGLEAAFLVSLLPTTQGILGPAFLVSVAIGILFIPLSLFVLHNIKGWQSTTVLAIFIAYLLSSHAYTALSVVIVSVPYLALNIEDDWRCSLRAVFGLGLPFLMVLPFSWHLVEPILRQLSIPQFLSPFVAYPNIISSLGYFTTSLLLVGTFYLAIRQEKRGLGLVLGLLLLLIIMVVFYVFNFGINVFYERSLIYAMMMASIIAGAGLAMFRKADSLPAWLGSKGRKIMKPAVVVVSLLLVGILMVTVIPERQDTPYYHMIDTVDYQTFCWIKSNVGSNYDKAVLDPWKATAFTAVTGIKVYSRITMSPGWRDKEAYNFLGSGCQDTEFLEKNEISLVYTRQECLNPELKKIADYVYVLKDAK